ncbi:unnamed protein product [Microthlaspi erraticum]|uniref:F-box domain-containing protein n=1 Tax=Microthlaspi erraticum TaxID=1685480 RepID=A0A6D2IA77_9BRAS|nr:unnamed protein product [Microthlaspi erraticum]
MTRRRKARSLPVVVFEQIPFDLVIEILLRSPVKSIGRFRSVSKLWESTIRSPDFKESFRAISSSRNNLLFTCLKDGETYFFSSPRPQVHPQKLPSPIAANVHMSFPINCPTGVCRPVRGLVCGLRQQTSKEGTVTVPLICNPSTGESLALPKVRTTKKGVMSCFGYDPIDKQFKVLCMTLSSEGGLPNSAEHQLLTLEEAKEKHSWKMIECYVRHYPYFAEHTNGFYLHDGICINGVLYYVAIVFHDEFDGYPDIACFDIRSEKFSYIKKADEGMNVNVGEKLESTLVNYKGKLAKLQPNIGNNNEGYNGIQLWVLEDAEKHEWSRHIYVFPLHRKSIFEKTRLCFVGTTSTGEIVLSPNTISDSFYLIYYNPERNTLKRVEVRGMEAYKSCKAYTFLDHVEDVTLLSRV